MRTILVLIFAAYAATAAVRNIREPLEMLPAHVEAPTRAEIVERTAIRAARADRIRALTELAAVVGAGCSTNSAAISNEVSTIKASADALRTFGGVIRDTRANISETAGLSDIDIAALYLQQTRKTAPALEAIAPTNRLDYLIGAGMRHDINERKEKNNEQ